MGDDRRTSMENLTEKTAAMNLKTGVLENETTGFQRAEERGLTMKIWIFPVGGLGDRELMELTGICQQDRKDRIEKIQNRKKKAQEAGAGFLLKKLQDELKISGGIEYLEHGKPYFPERQDIQFSIAHTDEYVILAYGPEPVGVDAEIVRRAPVSVAERFFRPEERMDLNSLEGIEQDSRFFEYWTGKEAYVKMTGSGLTCPLNSFGVNLPVTEKFLQAEDNLEIFFCREAISISEGRNTILTGVTLMEYRILFDDGSENRQWLMVMVCTDNQLKIPERVRKQKEKTVNLSFSAELVIIE